MADSQFRAVRDNKGAIIEAVVERGPKAIVEIAEHLKKCELLPPRYVLPNLAALESVSEQDRSRLYSRKVEVLLTPVQTVIKSNPTKYNDLLEVLKEHGLDSVVETLKKQCRKCCDLLLHKRERVRKKE